MASKVNVQPQTITVDGILWEPADIQALSDLFKGEINAAFEKREVRASGLLQKAMSCGAVVCLNVQVGDEITLSLAQVGLDLIGTL